MQAQAEEEAEVGRSVGSGVERKVEEEEVGRGGRVRREVEVEAAVEGFLAREEEEEDRQMSELVVLLGLRAPRMRLRRFLVPLRLLVLLLKLEGRKAEFAGGKKRFMYLFFFGIIVLKLHC